MLVPANLYIRSSYLEKPSAQARALFSVAGYAPLRKVLRTVAAWNESLRVVSSEHTCRLIGMGRAMVIGHGNEANQAVRRLRAGPAGRLRPRT